MPLPGAPPPTLRFPKRECRLCSTAATPGASSFHAEAARPLGSEDPILRCEVLILEQEFLIDQPADVRQQASPFVVWHEEHPS